MKICQHKEVGSSECGMRNHPLVPSHTSYVTSSAFSLIEIMITVAMLAFIIIGLVAMFNQTRRAFTSSITQVDVLESGRSAAEMITRQMEQISAIGAPSTGSGAVPNFYADSPVSQSPTPSQYLVNSLISVNGTEPRTNNLQRVCFFTRNNLTWNFTGYILLPTAGGGPVPYQVGIGTLYSYTSTNIGITNINALIANYNAFVLSTAPTNSAFSRLIDGVVDFRVRVYSTNGSPFLSFPSTTYVNASQNIFAGLNYAANDQLYNSFWSNSLPAYVEVELGVLEDRALARYQALSIGGTGPGSAAWNYLVDHPGQVHIFRQRVTVPNVNPAAY